MINLKFVKKCCIDDFSLIENYDKAINDETQCWDLHHKKENELLLSVKELKEQNLYFYRPASELIFLTRAEHNDIHHKGKIIKEHQRQKMREWHKNNKRVLSEETKKKIGEAGKGRIPWNKGLNNPYSEETRKRMSESAKNRECSIKGRKSMWKNGIKKMIKEQDIKKYLDDGWVIGKKK